MSASVLWVEASWAKSGVAFAAVVGWLENKIDQNYRTLKVFTAN